MPTLHGDCFAQRRGKTVRTGWAGPPAAKAGGEDRSRWMGRRSGSHTGNRMGCEYRSPSDARRGQGQHVLTHWVPYPPEKGARDEEEESNWPHQLIDTHRVRDPWTQRLRKNAQAGVTRCVADHRQTTGSHPTDQLCASCMQFFHTFSMEGQGNGGENQRNFSGRSLTAKYRKGGVDSRRTENTRARIRRCG